MDYTKNYHLPQWVKEDRIMMDDFNAMCADIEKGLTGNRAEASAGIAEAKADAARLPYAAGSYLATGEVQPIYLGFRPSFVIVSAQQETGETGALGVGTISKDLIATGGNIAPHRIQLTDSGFTVYPRGGEYLSYPNAAEKGLTYDYIAFR